MSSTIKEIVKEKYGETARRIATGQPGTSCCDSAASCRTVDPITSNLYDEPTNVNPLALWVLLEHHIDAGAGKVSPA